MFKNSEHAKKATKSLFDFVKANPKAKLSEFREFFASKASYNSFFDFLNNIGTTQEVKEISVLDLLSGDYAVMVNNTSFGRVFGMDDEVVINYDTDLNKHGIFMDEVSLTIPLENFKSAKVYGSKILVKDDCDELVELFVYLPMNSHQVKIVTSSSDGSSDCEELQLAFDIEYASVHQTVRVVNSNYDEESIIQGLEDGILATTTWFDNQSASEITVVATGEVIAVITSQEINGEYTDYR